MRDGRYIYSYTRPQGILMKELEDNPSVSGLGTNNECIAEYGESIAIREGVGLGKAGARNMAEEELVGEIRIVSGLGGATRVSVDKRGGRHGLPVVD